MSIQDICQACGTLLGPTNNKPIRLGDHDYCNECYILSSGVASALNLDQLDVITWLATDPPTDPGIGQWWVDIQGSHLMVCLKTMDGGGLWLDCVNGARWRISPSLHLIEQTLGERFAGPKIKQSLIDEAKEVTPCHPYDDHCGGPGGPCRWHGGTLSPTRPPDPQALTMWVIYKNPSDFAGRMKGDVYVLRRWSVGARESTVDRHATAYGNLEKIRSKVPPGLVCIKASPDDDPAVLETWF